MSSRRGGARRIASGNTESLTQSMNEVILQDCHALYIEGDDSLLSIGEDLELQIEPPRKKINIMLIGEVTRCYICHLLRNTLKSDHACNRIWLNNL